MNENDRFDPAKLDVREKWDALSDSTKRYIIYGLVVAAVILLAVFATYMTPGVLPNDEAGG